MWRDALPLLGILIGVALPLVRHGQKVRAESEAAAFLERVHAAQEAFRAGRPTGGYASALESLIEPCPGGRAAGPLRDAVASLTAAGYEPRVRTADGGAARGPDCHGRATFSDYYASAQPRSSEIAGQQAFAEMSSGRIFVFFDGVAPVERDMAAGGLATPLDARDQFRIP